MHSERSYNCSFEVNRSGWEWLGERWGKTKNQLDFLPAIAYYLY